ncbi:MAG: hypothetical protein NTW86_32045 [Candidatus Sumerlaeota bacterium]|nr:hypothetical protein [Candidatus Sumerlaeota bacterium]
MMALRDVRRFALAALSLAAVRMAGGAEAASSAPASAPAPEMQVEIDDRGALQSGFALFARPDEELRIHVRPSGSGQEWKAPGKPGAAAQASSYEIQTTHQLSVGMTGGALTGVLDDGIVWKAPKQSGWRKLTFSRKTSRSVREAKGDAKAGESEDQAEAAIELNVCVLYPFNAEKDEAIEGYPIGVYPNPAAPDAPSIVKDNAELYAPPKWFIQVTPATAKLKVSPSFTLGEFSPFEEAGKTHFIALEPRLVAFLEALRLAVQAESPQPRPIRILRGFLSPNDRARLETVGVKYAVYTRNQYGDGASIIVDGNGDGLIDDLDGDGKITSNDADVLADICEETQDRLRLFGGIGVMRGRKDPKLPDTPYVDVDLRGKKTRW